MKKLFKTALAMVCVFALGIVNVPASHTVKAEEVEKICTGGASVSIQCKQTDAITFASDDAGMTYTQTGYSSISIGGKTIYSVSFSINFSSAGEHTLTLFINGVEKETKKYNVFASHSWGSGIIKTEATCTKEGETEYTCENCGQKKTEKVAKLSHDYKETSRTEATCKNSGQITYTCSMCRDRKTETIPKKAHDYKSKVLEKATCEEDGETADVCSVCGDTINKKTISKTGHSWGAWKTTVKATIFDSGEEQRKCSVCGDIDIRDTEKLPSYVTLKKKSLKLKKGKKTTLKIKKKTSGDSIKSFRSSKKSVATVTKAGKITAKKKGTTTITLTMKSGCKATCKVVVK